MATTKKNQTSTKRALKVSEVKKIGKHYYALRKCVYDMMNDKDISIVAKKELNDFYKGLTKARQNFGIARATNFKADSF